MIFCVPSYGRAGRISKFITDELPKLGDLRLFVREKEQAAYRSAYPTMVIETVPDTADNIAKTRAHLCAIAKEKVWAMVDDDIVEFCIKPDTLKFGDVYKFDWASARPYIKGIEQRLKDETRVCVVGLPDRITLARPHDPLRSQLPVRQFIFLNREAAQTARYTMPLMSDIDCCLHWATQPEAVVYNHPTLGQMSPATCKTSIKGGCGEYREKNPTYYRDGYRELARRWPGIVKVEENLFGGFKKRISWSKVQ